ncbi:MAG: DNA-binding transcriptional regulator [Kiritimatiellales bacterium]
MTQIKKRKRVLLALGWHSYLLQRGVARYANQVRWVLNVEMERTGTVPPYWRGNGVICVLGVDDKLDRQILALNLPTVSISPVAKPHIPRVFCDNKIMAEMAVEHFSARGFKHFAYYICSGGPVEEMRATEFCKALRSQPTAELHELNWIAANKNRNAGSAMRIDWLGKRLKQLPKPLAVITEFDDRGVEVLQACENAGLRVPDDVAVLGADNDDLLCDFAPVPLSSIDTDLERQGYEAAALLNRIMSGKKPARRTLLVPPTGVIMRKSSDLLGIEHPHVVAALGQIRERYREPVTTKELCREIPMSYRWLHAAFQKHVGHTMAEELRNCRIRQAEKLLLDSARLKMEDIAEQAGFSSAGQMTRVFSHFRGVSPSNYRKKHTFNE